MALFRRSWAVIPFVAASLCLGLAAQKPYTVADIYAEPGLTGYAPSTVEWSPDGRHFTYLLQQSGDSLADLYIVDAATGQSRLLVKGSVLAGGAQLQNHSVTSEVRHERETRYGMASYHWSPKGDFLVYVNRDRLFRFTPATGQVEELSAEPGYKENPQISPDEQWISYVLDGDVHYLRLRDGSDAEATSIAPHQDQVINGGMDWVYPEELDLRSGYAWSPDSSRIAFMRFDEHPVPVYPIPNLLPHWPTVYEEKYPKAGDPNPILHFGVYSLATHRISWIHVAGMPDEYLPRIGWMPDGRHVYALVMNRAQTDETLYEADPDTGVARAILHESNPYWLDPVFDFHFFKTKPWLLWASDRDGWHHLYLFDLAGHELRKLTDGPWHVKHFEGVDEKGGWVYFTASIDLPYRTDLYRVSLSGGAPQRITAGDGTHEISLAPDFAHYLDTFSAAAQPPAMNLRTTAGGPAHVVHAAADVSAYDLQRPEFLQILAADGKTKLWAWMLKPPHFDPSRKYPVIMNQYGGPTAQTVNDAWGGATTWFDNLLLRDGFILFDVDNRANMYSDRAQQALVKHHFGRIELADQLAALHWLKTQPYVAADRIGIWGWSYGGYMTLYELTRAPGNWKAAIAVAPVTNWTDYDSIYTERYMGMPQTNPQGYHDSSPVNFADNLRDDLLLVHGSGDDNVNFQNSLQFIEQLVEHDKPFQLMIYPNRTHGISDRAARTHLFSLMENFWKRELQP